MPARPLPNLLLQAFFDLGEKGWNDEYDLNWLKVSVLTQAGVSAKVAEVPVAPAAGEIVVLDETNATNPNAVAVFDDGEWVYFQPNKGWLVYDQTLNQYLTFDGALWVALVTGGGGGSGDITRLVAFFFTTPPAASETLLLYTASETISFPIDFAGSAGSAGTNPTAAMTLNVLVNGAAAGTINISTGGVVSFTAAAAIALVAGDRLSVVAPASADATIANVAITLRGTAS